jgi:hypothetical protein
MNDILSNKATLDFLRYCLHNDAAVPETIGSIDWDALLDFGKRQSIRGVLLHGIQKLPASAPHPSFPQLKRWLQQSIAIKTANIQTYRDAVTVTQRFHEETGCDSVVMKGQANALRYPDPYMREPGDIDLWTTATTKQLIRWAHSHDAKGSVEYHHVDLNVLPTPVELHYVPSFMGNLFYEWRMRRWFKKEKPRQFGNKATLPDGLGEIGILEPSFDCVFQLSHMMHHFFFEGIGFRQVIDFYYLLSAMPKDDGSIMKVVKWLNMSKFTAAVMYVLHDVLGMPQEKLLCPPNEKIGQLFLYEILKAGNFGFHDTRYHFEGLSRWDQYKLETRRNLHFAKEFPSEVVFGRPVSRWWHAVYKLWLSSSAG